jgi:hypothetical protein
MISQLELATRIARRASVKCLGIGVLVGSLITGLAICTPSARGNETIARIWNEQLLDAIRNDTARPTVHARNLHHLSIATYDAWAAYEILPRQVLHEERAAAVDLEAARREAISFAAYNIIKHRFVSCPAGIGPGKDHT